MNGYCLISSAVSKTLTCGVQNRLRPKFSTAQAAQFFTTDVALRGLKPRALGFSVPAGSW